MYHRLLNLGVSFVCVKTLCLPFLTYFLPLKSSTWNTELGCNNNWFSCWCYRTGGDPGPQVVEGLVVEIPPSLLVCLVVDAAVTIQIQNIFSRLFAVCESWALERGKYSIPV